MGSLILSAQGVPYVDTNGFIYTVELVAPYQALLEPLWQELRVQGRYALTSELTLMDILVKPLQAQDVALETQYRSILVSSPEVRLYPISRAVLERAARLRTTAQFKTPDALHAATALEAGCAVFVTNDAAFRRVISTSSGSLSYRQALRPPLEEGGVE